MEGDGGEQAPQRRNRPVALAQELHPEHPHPARAAARLELQPVLTQELVGTRPQSSAGASGRRPADAQETQAPGGPPAHSSTSASLSPSASPPGCPHHSTKRSRRSRLLRSQIRSQRSPTPPARPQHEHRQQHQHRHHQHQLQRQRPRLTAAPPTAARHGRAPPEQPASPHNLNYRSKSRERGRRPGNEYLLTAEKHQP